jgi:hypothetical protein
MFIYINKRMRNFYLAEPAPYRSNQLCPEFDIPDYGMGFIYDLGARCTRQRPINEPYYYYIYAYNNIFQRIAGVVAEHLHTHLVLPPDVREDVFQGRCKILIDHCLEGFHVSQYNFDMIKAYLGEYYPHTILVTGDYRQSTSTEITSLYTNYWEKVTAQNLTENDTAHTNPWHQEQLNRKPYTAKFKAICKNRLLRSHRIAIVKNIHDYDLADKINYSFGIVTRHGSDDSTNYVHREFTGRVTKTAAEFGYDPEELLAFVVRHGEKNLHGEKVNLSVNHARTISDSLLDAHRESYFEIVVETNFNSDTIFHSEKTFKSISWMQPFVLCAERYSVQALRDFGYDVFDDIFDHSYDNVKDNVHRMKALFEEIQRLCAISDSEWNEILSTIRQRLMANVENLNKAGERFVI